MTLIEGERGVIVIDPLISTETARAGLELYYQHRGRRPVTAVIYTHSHTDHYGGVRGVVDEADVRAGRVPVIAPDGFMEEVVSENVHRRHPHDAPRAVPVRRHPAQGAARSGGRRASAR